MPHDRRGRHPRRAPPLRARTPTPTTPATSSTAPTASACSATWPPSCASVTDGDEGLFASYSDVQFQAPVRAGDVLEIACELTRVGTRSRTIDFTVHVVARGAADRGGPGAAAMLDQPLLATTATGAVVVPPPSGPSPDWSEPRRGVSRHDTPRPVRFSMNFSVTGRPRLTCAFSRSSQVSGRLTPCAATDEGSASFAHADRVGGPTSEWPSRMVGGHPPVRHGSRRSVPPREGGSGRGVRPLDNFPVAAASRGRVGPKGRRPSRCPARLRRRLPAVAGRSRLRRPGPRAAPP